MKGAQTLVQVISDAIKEGATVNDIIKSTVKPTVGAVFEATFDYVASKLIEMRNIQNDLPSFILPIVLLEFNQARSRTMPRRD